MSIDYNEYVPGLKALADETRLKIVEMLSCGELCACQILESFNITQPTLSYHMKVLTDSGIVIGQRDGAWMNYSLDSKRIDEISQLLNMISKDHENCICKNVKYCNGKCK